MKTDLYTKSVLSIIAVALVTLVIQNTKPNEAQAGNTNFNHFASVPVNDDGSINVRMTSDMDVNIRSIGGSSVYGALPVNLKELSGSSISSSNGIPVNIEALNGSSIYSALPVKETH